MAPPCFGDLGKDARDLFSKGFHNGLVKLDVKTVADNKVEFKLSGTHTQSSSKSDGSLEAKMKFKEQGLSITETWDTKNQLGAKVELEDKLLKGFKLTLDSKFDVADYKRSATMKTNYKNDFVNFNTSHGLKLAAPVITASTVFGCPHEKYEAFLLGGELKFDTGKRALLNSHLVLGYSQEQLKVHAHVKDLSQFNGTIYHKVRPDTELGVDIEWTKGIAACNYALAVKHKVDKHSYGSIVVDNTSLVKLACTNTVRPGVKLTLSSGIVGNALSGGDHKVGLGLDVDLS
jgi:hypothetical protein